MLYVPMGNAPHPWADSPDTGHTDRGVDVRGEAVLERSRFSWIWIVPACLYCGQEHHHYGGPLDGDPYQYTGHSVPARCTRTEEALHQQALPLATRAYRLVPAPMRLQRRACERQFQRQELIYASTIDRHH